MIERYFEINETQTNGSAFFLFVRLKIWVILTGSIRSQRSQSWVLPPILHNLEEILV